MSEFNIPAEVSVQAFNLDVHRVVGSPSSALVEISYRAYGPVSGSNTLVSWEYSLNSGATWETMTLSDPSEVNNISFSPTGTLNILNWSAYGDIGSKLFNNDIYIRLSATDGTHNTPKEVHSFFIEKRYKAKKTLDPIKNDFAGGIPGNKVLPQLFATPSNS